MDGASPEFRLFLEDVACDLFFFDHLAGVPPESIDVHQEVYLGPDAFAAIRVKAGDAAPYFVEIKPGYSGEGVLESITRKYGTGSPASNGAARLIVVADASVLADAALERELRAVLRAGLELELWEEQRLFDAIEKRFGLHLDPLGEQDLLGLRSALDHAKGVYAFGKEFQNDPIEASLLWHLAPRQLRRLRESGRTSPRAILPPGLYPDVVVVMADICSYTSYVRETRDEAVSRRALTSYASKTRYQITSDGGMLYQFLGDSVIGLFGIPERTPDDAVRALHCARRLVEIGAAVAREWQRDIDQIQSAADVHVAMALGDLQVLSLRPFSRTHMGVVGDSINLCARLNGAAGCDEIVVSNKLYRALPDVARREFQELAPVDAKNIGRVRAWKLGPLHRAG
jgi:adenylate cyclase